LKTQITVGDVLDRVSVKDTVFTASILGLAYHVYLCYNTIKLTSHQHKSEQQSISLASTQVDIPFGFSTGEDD
jgi:hypothetical protein